LVRITAQKPTGPERPKYHFAPHTGEPKGHKKPAERDGIKAHFVLFWPEKSAHFVLFLQISGVAKHARFVLLASVPRIMYSMRILYCFGRP